MFELELACGDPCFQFPVYPVAQPIIHDLHHSFVDCPVVYANFPEATNMGVGDADRYLVYV